MKAGTHPPQLKSPSARSHGEVMKMLSKMYEENKKTQTTSISRLTGSEEDEIGDSSVARALFTPCVEMEDI